MYEFDLIGLGMFAVVLITLTAVVTMIVVNTKAENRKNALREWEDERARRDTLSKINKEIYGTDEDAFWGLHREVGLKERLEHIEKELGIEIKKKNLCD